MNAQIQGREDFRVLLSRLIMLLRGKGEKNKSKRLICSLGIFLLVLCGCSCQEAGAEGKKVLILDDSATEEEMEYSDPLQNQEGELFGEPIREGGEAVGAVYLGVENYGDEQVNQDTKDYFSYRFWVDGKEEVLTMDNGAPDEEGNYAYPLQNLLKEGYSYELQIRDGVVIGAEEKKEADREAYQPPVEGIPGERTLKNFLATAFMPVGITLYVYGGGWNWQDDGSAVQTRTIGVSQDWVRFFREQDGNYTYREKDGNEGFRDPAHSYYPYGGYNEYYYAGLDCSGYVGWVLYNVLNTESGLDGYVMGSTKTAKRYAENGWGEWTRDIVKPKDGGTSQFYPGDIFSISGHVWICVGTCEDGSLLILHSTPAESRTGQPGGGPELSAIGKDKSCKAYKLADRYMSEYFPDWYERYAVALKSFEQYTSLTNENAGKFSWNLTGENGGISDPDHFRDMTPEEILEDLFGG